MRVLILHIVFLAFFVGSCSTSQLAESEINRGKKLNSVKAYFYDSSGLKVLDSETNTTNSLIEFTHMLVQRKISSDNSKIAINYFENDSSKLVVLDTSTEQIWEIESKPDQYVFTFEWSPRSDSLAVGYFTEKKSGDRYVAGEGGILISSFKGIKREVGCSVSKSVDAWLPDGRLAVSSGLGSENLYIVNKVNCNTIQTINKEDKRAIIFSPDGNKILFTRFEEVHNRSSGTTQKLPELFILDVESGKETKIAGYQHEPRNASWSPGGDKIAFDIQSDEWSNVHHISIYDLEKGEAQFIVDRDGFYGVANDQNPHWDKTGSRLLINRSYESTSGLITNQKVIRNLSNGEELKLVEKINDPNNYNDIRIGTPLDWFEEDLIAFSGSGYKVFNTSGDEILSLSNYQNLLFAVSK